MKCLTLREAAEALNISTRTLTRLASKKKVPGFKLGGQWRFSREHIERWIERELRTDETRYRDRKSVG